MHFLVARISIILLRLSFLEILRWSFPRCLCRMSPIIKDSTSIMSLSIQYLRFIWRCIRWTAITPLHSFTDLTEHSSWTLLDQSSMDGRSSLQQVTHLRLSFSLNFLSLGLTNGSLFTYFLDNERTSTDHYLVFALRQLNDSSSTPPWTNEWVAFTSNYERASIRRRVSTSMSRLKNGNPML